MGKHTLLKRMIPAVLCALAIFIIAAFGAHVFIEETTEDINQQQQQFLSEIATQNARSVQRTVQMNLDELKIIANILNHEGTFRLDHVMGLLKLENKRSSFKRMGYANLEGDALTTDGEVFSIADRDYFSQALGGQGSISDRLTDKTDGGSINVYAVPLYHQDTLEGVLFATSETSEFTNLLSTPLFDGQGFSYVITEDGTPVVFSENHQKFSEFENFFEEIRMNEDGEETMRQLREDMQNKKSGILEYQRDHVARIGAYSSVEVNDWYVVSVVPKEVISQNAYQIVLRNVSIAVFTAVMSVGLILFILIQNAKNRTRLERIAYYDELIEMPNFNSFQEQAQRTLEERAEDQFSFVKLDVDKFKLINDRFGFAEGDRVLKNMAKALRDVVKEEDELFARVAVDEFILMLNATQKDELEALQQRFMERFDALMGPALRYYVRFPSGRYITTPGECSMKDIFEKVNYAHRQAKLMPEKSGVWEFHYDDAEKAKALRETELQDKMHSALEHHEFKVYLQPKYELKHETIVGAEALVRWQEANGDLVSPAEFIPLFERNGFIIQLDLFMFEQVCAILRDWMERAQPLVTISVNFSRLHLLNPHFIEELVTIADRYVIPKECIEIELTETVVFEYMDQFVEVLEQLHEAGFTMSMDDFGAGHSSLGLLKNLSVDAIKMDRSFFANNKQEHRTKTVVGCVIDMAQKLNIHTVAEGVEQVEHILFLREVGCEVVQGYYYAKPMPAEEFNRRHEFPCKSECESQETIRR